MFCGLKRILYHNISLKKSTLSLNKVISKSLRRYNRRKLDTGEQKFRFGVVAKLKRSLMQEMSLNYEPQKIWVISLMEQASSLKGPLATFPWQSETNILLAQWLHKGEAATIQIMGEIERTRKKKRYKRGDRE